MINCNRRSWFTPYSRHGVYGEDKDGEAEHLKFQRETYIGSIDGDKHFY